MRVAGESSQVRWTSIVLPAAGVKEGFGGTITVPGGRPGVGVGVGVGVGGGGGMLASPPPPPPPQADNISASGSAREVPERKLRRSDMTVSFLNEVDLVRSRLSADVGVDAEVADM